MASTRRQQHHARFHAAVLRHFFPPPPPSPPSSDFHQEAPKAIQEVDVLVQSPKLTELVTKETCTNSEEVKVRKAIVSRAQRKRFKVKKVKETQVETAVAKTLIGPLLPNIAEKRKLENYDRNSADALQHESIIIERTHNISSSSCDQDLKEMRKPDFLITALEEELAANLREVAVPSLNETGENKDVNDGVERESLSRTKRRRLAKKKLQDSSSIRCTTAGSSFTAEVKGETIIIKPIV